MVDTPNKFSLWALEIFVASVEEGTISAAATRLKASASTVSQHLSNLEAALGTELLDRSTRPMKPTKMGQMFLRRARVILSEVMQAKAELAQFDHSKMVRLRLGVIDDFDADITPALMKSLARKMRNCRFLLESGNSYTLTSDLQSQALDVIVTADLDNAQGWMDIYPLVTEPFIVAAPRGAVDQGGDVQEQLFKLPFVRYSSREMMGRQIETHLTRQRISLPNKFEFNNYHAILSLVADGTGWTITTPMGFLRAQRFMDSIDLMPLPFKSMSRSISLIAQKGAMDRIPAEIAEALRPAIKAQMIDKMLEITPWLEQKFRLLP
ncbi:LysR family transcriptional regulator [Amylibacter marinus]|uniref:LysR family transcriptional regulator n=1 Tax=Amylibacter marinus TaxID=1475483 RepID=A0ABQ5VTG2_9RHOB|nr:LysR family transcriptional regulator [Amylibacter marinus]GLQ34614.1 LysR family transcriptional regulator [Amylibacter marinus]